MNRTAPDPRHLPENVIAFRMPEERRSKPRWMERMEQQGMPVVDTTSRIYVGPKDAA